jgi:hypothetical protein
MAQHKKMACNSCLQAIEFKAGEITSTQSLAPTVVEGNLCEVFRLSLWVKGEGSTSPQKRTGFSLDFV